MERFYNVGSGGDQITLGVNTSTAATCYTVANQVLLGGQKVFKGESTIKSNGTIQSAATGLPSDLQSTEMIIQTIADFSALPQDVIDSIKNDAHTLKIKLLIEYDFDRGATGDQKYDWDYDDYVISADGKIVVVTKKIALNP